LKKTKQASRREGQLVVDGDVAEEQGPANHNTQVGGTGADEGVGEVVQGCPVHRRHEDVPNPRPEVAPRRGSG
jgi:hypothetical protein